MSTVPNPTWIQWSNPTKQYYRKITNLYGGQPGTPDVQWLSDWNTDSSNVYRSADTVKGPIYDKNPKYLWFLDTQNQKLKFSANTPETLSLNPVAPTECLSNNSGETSCGSDSSVGPCCNGSSTEWDCLLRWHFQKDNTNTCGDNKNHFEKSSSACDRWAYQEMDIDYSVPIVDRNDPNYPGTNPQNFGGTFCDKLSNKKWYMKTWMGCDCRGGKCQNFNQFACGDNSVYGDQMANIDDPDIAYGPDPTAYRAQWQFIDEENAFACCSQSYRQIQQDQPLQCKYSFNPTGSSKCPLLVQNYCKDNWGLNTDIGNQCQSFLANSDANRATTQQTLQNYITSRSENGQPQDYISYDLWQLGDKTSSDYYNKNTCSVSYESNGCDSQNYDPVTNPCCRDDSKDPFFTFTVPYLCNYQYNTQDHEPPSNSMSGVCDSQLQYFCQSFTRDQLAKDLTLQNICGCNLITNPQTPPANPDILMSPPMELDRCGGVSNGKCEYANPSPYYINANTVGDNCDIICNTALVQSGTLGGKCTQPVCTIDNVTINQINSTTGGSTTISQNCYGGTCYINDASINEINSNVGGTTQIVQNCSSCYITSNNDLLTAQPVDCNTLDPVTPNTPSSGGSSRGWINKLFNGDTVVLIILIAIAAVIICFFIAAYYNKKYEKKISDFVPPEGVIFGDEYWDSY